VLVEGVVDGETVADRELLELPAEPEAAGQATDVLGVGPDVVPVQGIAIESRKAQRGSQGAQGIRDL
jgi:hypothetical protein